MRAFLLGLGLAVLVSCAPAAAPISAIFEAHGQGTLATVDVDRLSPSQHAALAQMTPRDTDEIFLFETSYPGGGDAGVIQVSVSGTRAELRYVEEKRYRLRTDRYFRRFLDATELVGLRDLVRTKGIDRLASKEFGGFDGVEYRWTHLDRHGARQVLLNNPREEEQPAGALIALLERLRDARPLECVYNTRIGPGAELLYASPLNEARQVWAKGDDVRVLAGVRQMGDGEWLAYRKGQWEPCQAPTESSGGGATRNVRWRDGYVTALGKGTWLVQGDFKPEKLLGTALDDFVVVPETNILFGENEGCLYAYDLAARKEIALPASTRDFRFFEYNGDMGGVLLFRPVF